MSQITNYKSQNFCQRFQPCWLIRQSFKSYIYTHTKIHQYLAHCYKVCRLFLLVYILINRKNIRFISYHLILIALFEMECHVSSEMTSKCPVSQRVWHAKKPLLVSSHKWRAQVKICIPILVPVSKRGKSSRVRQYKPQLTNKQ